MHAKSVFNMYILISLLKIIKISKNEASPLNKTNLCNIFWD
jgi:hypothetical protein